MASVIKLKRSSVAGKLPNTSNLSTGELALNLADKRLYSANSSAVIEIGSNPNSLSVGTGGFSIGNGAITFPTSDGTSGQTVITNGSGSLSFGNYSYNNLSNLPNLGQYLQVANTSVFLRNDSAQSIDGQFTVGRASAYDSNGKLNVYGSGRNLFTIQTDNNALDRGIAFRNIGGAYIGTIYIKDRGVGDNLGDMYFGVSNATETDPGNVDDRMVITYDGILKVNNHVVWHAGNDGTGSGLDADLLDGINSSSFLRSDEVDTATTIQFDGGVTYDPAGAEGTDTATDVGIALTSGTRIVGTTRGYIRTLLEWNDGGDIEIGQGGTALISGINLLPGSSGNAEVNGNRILTVLDATSFLKSDEDDTASGNITFTGNITSTNNFTITHSTDTDVYMQFYCESGTSQIADTFSGTTDKKYIFFSNPNSSNDPGFIMHETRGGESNEGVLHLVPSDDNAEGDYVSIHGTNDPDVLRLHTNGLIETASGFTLNFKSAGSNDVQVNGNRILTTADEGSGNGLDADTLDTLQATSFLRSDADDTATGNINLDGITRLDQVRSKNSNVQRFSQVYSGGDVGSPSGYFSSGEYQEILGLIPSGSSQNYQVIGRIAIQSGGSTQVIYFQAALRSNTLPDLSWSISYYEEIVGGTRYVDPVLWVKETTTAEFKLALNGLATIFGTVTVDIDIIHRAGNTFDNVTMNTDSVSEVLSVPADFTSYDFTRLYTINNGIRYDITPYSNNNVIWHAGNDGSGSTLDADLLDGEEGSHYLDYNNFTNTPNLGQYLQVANTSSFVTTTTITDYSISPRFGSSIGMGNDTAVLFFNDANSQTRSGYWSGRDGFEVRGDNNSKDNVVLQTGYLDLTQNAYIDGILGIGSSFSTIASSPTSKLFVGGDISISNGTSSILGNLYYTTSWKYVGNGYGWGFRLDNSSGVLQFLRASNNSSGADANASVSLNSTINVDLANDRVGIGTATPGYKLEVNGSFAATTKSFVIPHPTKKGKKLRHGSLEGPENGVYVRGSTTSKIIKLPSYWTKLVDPESITVNLTPKGEYQQLFVEKIENNNVYVKNAAGKNINCFYQIFAERIDVDKLEVEYADKN